MGIRIHGPKIQKRTPEDIITEGLPLGAVQVTGNGDSIITFVDHQTTGGYPKIANVIAADMHKVGQLRPEMCLHLNSLPWTKQKRIISLRSKYLNNDRYQLRHGRTNYAFRRRNV